jgi:hypothetical protein
MKLTRHLQATFGIHAPKVTIRPHVPWHWRGIGFILIVAVATTLLWWFFNTGQKFAGFDRMAFEGQLSEASSNVQRLTVENAQLKSNLDSLQQQAQIEHAAQAELSKNVAQLQDENAHLKEEVTFFRSIMSTGKAPGGLSVQNFRVEADTLPNEYRFQALFVQGGQRDRDFIGRAQLVVNVLKNGANTVLTFPDDEKSASAFDINLKYYQRLEGRFKVETGAVVKSVQLRVTERATGQVKLTRSLSLS